MLAVGLSISGVPHSMWGQAIPRPEYVTYLPREAMRPVGATEASARLGLFGDRMAAGYADLEPRNGIDDRRDRVLHAIGVRFAPWLVRNAYSFPLDIARLIRERDVPLVRDRFNLARHDPVLLSSDTLRLAAASAPCSASAPNATDCRLLELFRRHGPQAAAPADAVTPESDPQTVLYFDFPGDSPKTWAREYGRAGSGFDVSPRYVGYARLYLHPFIADAPPGPEGNPRYTLVLQYWFYYPANDGGNTHEGDWEHINVVTAARERLAEPFDEATIVALLDGRLDLEALVIQRIEYYFHHWVFNIDYTRPNVYLDRAAWQQQRDSLTTHRNGERATWDAIRRQAYLDDDETRLNLHPLVYIGGDGRGLGLLLKQPGALGLSSHGSYPFPGLYKGVGPVGTGESIGHRWDLHRDAPAADASETEQLIRFDNPNRIEVLPDWERLADLALEDPAVRSNWAWFLLPVHSGYPATKSTFAGVVRYAETGNVGAVAPAYNSAWNRSGAAAGYADFSPHRIGSLFPLDVQDTYNARWGYLNATLPTLSFLPPLDLIIRAIERPAAFLLGHPMPTFATSATIPARRIGISFGKTRYQPSPDFANLMGFPELSSVVIQEANKITGTPLLGYGLGRATFTPLNSWLAQIDLYLGDHFVTGNALSHGTSRFRRDVIFDAEVHAPEPLTADLEFWEYSGSLRWSFTTGRVQPFLAAGYGLTWYRLANFNAFGHTVDGRWVKRPGLVHNVFPPNTYQFGGGIELLPRYGFGKLNLGIKATAELRTHRLGLQSENESLFFQDTRLTRFVVGLALTIAY